MIELFTLLSNLDMGVATTSGEATARELALAHMGVATASEEALGHSKRCCGGEAGELLYLVLPLRRPFYGIRIG